jgi:phage terminase small subunit
VVIEPRNGGTQPDIADRPAEPSWSGLYRTKLDQAIAHRIWSETLDEMAARQTLAIVNGAAIKRYVMFQVEFERAARDVAKGGIIRKARRTKVPLVHPAWGIMKQAADAAASLEAELAISPRRRNNGGKVQRKETRVSRADTFLGKRKPDHLRPVS